jgi:hypothetical protein
MKHAKAAEDQPNIFDFLRVGSRKTCKNTNLVLSVLQLTNCGITYVVQQGRIQKS